jgi:4-hydroxy-tetrahydrodipicolinate reductase
MINGMPGLMAVEVAKECLDRGLNILPVGFTGPSVDTSNIVIDGKARSINIKLIKEPNFNNEIKALKSMYPDLICIDYTHPSAVLGNVKCYVENGCDFVMGTTGGDPIAIQELLKNSNITTVIAPNMAKQIVAVQATLRDMSLRFPGSFNKYKLSVSC